MSIDNPFAAPITKDESEASLNVFRVDGDRLVCGAETSLAFLCWLTGERMRPDDRPTHHTIVAVYWPAPLRRISRLLGIAAAVTFPLMAARSMWEPYMVGCTLLLLLVFTKRLRPKVTLRIAVSPLGQQLRRRHNTLECLRLLMCGLSAVAVFRYSPAFFAAWGLPITSYEAFIPATFAFFLTWRLCCWLVPPVLSLSPPVVADMQNDLFTVKHVPMEMLRGLEQLLAHRVPDADLNESAS